MNRRKHFSSDRVFSFPLQCGFNFGPEMWKPGHHSLVMERARALTLNEEGRQRIYF
jgi:hypothetical protein